MARKGKKSGMEEEGRRNVDSKHRDEMRIIMKDDNNMEGE